MKKQYLKSIISILTLLSIAGCLTAAESVVADMPDFETIFAQLDFNRSSYNAINDSLFLPNDEADWLKLAMRRAEGNLQTYEENQKLIDQVTYYFLEKPDIRIDATSGKLKLKKGIRHEAYDAMRDAMFKYKNCLDPAMGEIFVGNILLPYLETQDPNDPDIAAHMTHDYFCYGDCLYSIFCMGDSTALPKAYDMFRKSISAAHKCPKDRSETVFATFAACHLLSRPRLNREGQLRSSEADSMYHFLMANLERPGVREKVENSIPYYYNRSFYNMGQHYPIYRLRSLILEEDKLETDTREEMELRLGIMSKYYEKNELSMKFDSLHVLHSTRMLVRARAGNMTYRAAMDSCLVYYHDWEKVLNQDKEANFTDRFRHFVYVCKDILYLMEHADIDAHRKTWIARVVCRRTNMILKNRPHGELDSQDTNLLMILLFDPNLFKHLSLADRTMELKLLLTVTQLQTLAHNDCVVWLSNSITNALIEHRPDMLVGIFGTQTPEEVKALRKEIEQFVLYGAFIHDLGKLRMSNIIGNEFRHLTDHEFELIKLHPEYAQGIVKLIPEYNDYLDFALGHHRWYDGSAGYPMWYDNTKSNVRLLVDILTIADCLEAATNRLSRNYRRFKSFEETFEEFRQGAGTHYNADVIKAIDAIPELEDNLKFLIENGWQSSYSGIFENMSRY